jgi:hypothetical protein
MTHNRALHPEEGQQLATLKQYLERAKEQNASRDVIHHLELSIAFLESKHSCRLQMTHLLRTIMKEEEMTHGLCQV